MTAGSSPRIGVLALQGDVREHLRALEAVGAHGIPVRRTTELAGCDGLILPGGESTTIVKLATAFDLLEPLRSAIKEDCRRTALRRHDPARRSSTRRRGSRRSVASTSRCGATPSVARSTRSKPTSSFRCCPARRCTRSSSGHRVESAGPEVHVLARVDAAAHSPAGKIVAARQGHLLATSFHPESLVTRACTRCSSRWCSTSRRRVIARERPPEVGYHQAQEGSRRRPTRQVVREADQERRGRGADRRRRPGGNPTLYDAIQKAKKSSVPNENIDRAVKRGSGADSGGVEYQSITHEGTAPAASPYSSSASPTTATERRRRRTAMTRNGGSMADPGSVAYLFHRKGLIVVPKSDGVEEDDVLSAVLEAARRCRGRRRDLRGVTETADLVAVRGASASWHRLRLGGAHLPPPERDRATRRGRRAPYLPAGRGTRGQRRRAERLCQLRRHRRGHGEVG